MIARTLSRRLERLEDTLLPVLEEPNRNKDHLRLAGVTASTLDAICPLFLVGE